MNDEEKDELDRRQEAVAMAIRQTVESAPFVGIVDISGNTFREEPGRRFVVLTVVVELRFP